MCKVHVRVRVQCMCLCMCTLLTTYRALKDVVALVRGLSLLDERLARLELLLLADAREDFLRMGGQPRSATRPPAQGSRVQPHV